MTHEYRDMKDFKKFPGRIVNNIYVFPELWHTDEAGRLRVWLIQIRLVARDHPCMSCIDWSMMDEPQLPMRPAYLTQAMPDNIVAQMWVETGIATGKITRNIPTYFDTPTNAGKADERNVLQTAMIMARGQWMLKINQGCSESKKPLAHSTLYFPMLAKNTDKYLKFPAYIQPKLDGVRCLVFLKKVGHASQVIAYTRNRKLIESMDDIKKRLAPYLTALYDHINNQSIYLDGELYTHGKHLQEISGDARQSKNQSRMEYHIYDCFYPYELDTVFSERHAQVTELFNSMSTADSAFIKRVATKKINSRAEIVAEYKKFIAAGYEGAMVRNADGPYLASAVKTGTNLRSDDLIKYKPVFSDEFECVDYTQGSRGKDRGAVIWQCKTKAGAVFNVTPKLDYAERYRLYAECEEYFKNNGKFKYAGWPLTVEYQDLSKAGVPLRAKSVEFRVHE
jgi:ATP-dependent DNA ligase